MAMERNSINARTGRRDSYEAGAGATVVAAEPKRSSIAQQFKISPYAGTLVAILVAGLVAYAVVTLVDYQERQRAVEAELNWSPFDWHEITATHDGEILYFTLSGFKSTTAAQEARTHSFIVGDVPDIVTCYRPDGTVCEPNPLVGPATVFRSPVFRVLVPANILSDTRAAFRVCYTYDSRTWCDEILVSEIREAPAPDEGLEIITPAISGEPRQIAPL